MFLKIIYIICFVVNSSRFQQNSQEEKELKILDVILETIFHFINSLLEEQSPPAPGLAKAMQSDKTQHLPLVALLL